MKKGLVTVFVIIGILVLGLIIWAVVFNGGFQQAFDSIGNTINGIWGGITGDSNAQLFNPNQLSQGSNYTNLGDAKAAFGSSEGGGEGGGEGGL